MNRFLPLAVLLCIVLTLAVAPATLADEPARDPRCADWEQNGAPAGIDMRLVCTANEVIDAYTGQASTGDLASEPLMPYIVGLLVAGLAFAVAGVVAMRFVGAKAGKRLAPERPETWWACPRCHSLNAEGRTACYACHASRSEVAAGDAPMVITRAD